MGKIKLFLVGFLGSIFIRVLGRTITLEESPTNYSRELDGQDEKVIYAFWHSLMLVPVYVGKNLGVKVLISQHADGEYIAQVVQRLGHNVVRGSTTRGGARALLSFIKNVKEDKTSLAITPDGPRGPRFIVQPGIIFLGQKTGYPILPVSLGLTSYWELPSWDRFRIPKPFSKAILMYGDPIKIPPKLDKDKIDEYRMLLEKKLNEMTVEAERVVKDM